MADTNEERETHFALRRVAGGRRGAGRAMAHAGTRVGRLWQRHRWLRWLALAFAAGLLAMLALWIAISRDLPDARTLVDYEPPLPTMVRGIDGDIVGSYARDRRVQLQYVDFPRPLVNAFLSAEDETFWRHGGVDLTGTLNAVADYARKYGSDERAVGGSTITQQVAKNILLGDEYSVTRKLKEMVLARRIESVLSKPQILELYLNEIPLGRRSFGVQAAARAYFDRDVDDLSLAQAAFLAILPKAPERYGRKKYEGLAITRRNYVLDKMAENEWASPSEVTVAKAEPLGLVTQRNFIRTADAGYFLEEVRRELIDRYGEKAEDGQHSVYAGGLWVRTSLDMGLQDAARAALRAGLIRYQGGAWRGPIETLDADDGALTTQLAARNLGIAYKDWRIGVVTARSGGGGTIGFSDGTDAPLTGLPSAIEVGDVTAVSPSGKGFAVRAVPTVSGGMVAQDPRTGRVYAMQGGFDSRLGSFNRATQALRQPGSTIKPFVYATGLDNGMTPASMVPDQSYCVYQGARLGQKCFTNFGGGRGGGVHTMRWGLEQSRNLMTVHIAAEAGMGRVVKTFERMGIGSYTPYLSYALGAGDTTVQRMVNAYAALANNGLMHDASLIDYVQDRRGKLIWRADKRDCTGCNMARWDGKPMPRFKQRGRQVMDPRTAYQTVHMLEGVVQRGTATALRDLGMPMFGKTGTTNGPTNVWFIGGTPEIVAGVYLGYDKPRNLGGYAQGGTIAAPMVKQFITDTKSRWNVEPFVAPAGVRMIRIDRQSGKRVYGGWPTDEPKAGLIWEAFKPDTEPTRATQQDVVSARRREILGLLRSAERAGVTRQPSPVPRAAPAQANGDFVAEQGGLY